MLAKWEEVCEIIILECSTWLIGVFQAEEKEQEKKKASKSGAESEAEVGEKGKQSSEPEVTVERDTSDAATTEDVGGEASLSERENPINTASRQLSQGSPKSSSAEKTFSLLFLNPALFTLAAVLPDDVGGWGEWSDELHQTVGEQVLPALLEVSACTAFQSLTSRLAYIVTAQYMSRISPEVKLSLFSLSFNRLCVSADSRSISCSSKRLFPI